MAAPHRQPARGGEATIALMKLLDLTLPTPEENLALDEALLLSAEEGQGPEVLRIWESPQPLVVVGRASRIEQEVDVQACQTAGVPVLRRHSGGSTIVAGPGCLMYAVVLSYERRPQLQMIDHAHRFVLDTIAGELQLLHPDIERAGTSDLTIGGQKKFSGNALRCCRGHLLYHGTLLYDFPLAMVGELLRQPPRQPEYRDARTHGEFITNLPQSREEIRQALMAAWASKAEMDDLATLTQWPQALTNQLAQERYASRAWNWQR